MCYPCTKCGKCGRPIPEEGKCMQCGFVNEPGTFICANCGNFMPVPPGVSQKGAEATASVTPDKGSAA